VDVELTAEDVDADAENGRGVISIGPENVRNSISRTRLPRITELRGTP
jgi:hypothetical protein